MFDQVIPAILVSIVAFFSVYVTTPFLIRALEKRNITVKDYNRKGGAMVPRPGGPSILIGIVASELVLYIFFPTTAIITILITTSLAFVVGIIDDRKVLGGWFKP
ncbi:MAG: UDP-N-acetylglucosamine-1-phosphate transferase, partial [Nitrosopumilaceae archaeon]